MSRPGTIVAVVVALAAFPLAQAPASAQQPVCTTLSCEQCREIADATCQARSKACDAGRQRGCAGRFRSCLNGLEFELCVQCMPVQYLEGGRRFGPGRTELCRTDPR